jgi:hypothetical protein
MVIRVFMFEVFFVSNKPLIELLLKLISSPYALLGCMKHPQLPDLVV